VILLLAGIVGNLIVILKKSIMANLVKTKHTYFSIFKVEDGGVLKLAEDFIGEAQAHEYASEQGYTDYVVLPLIVVDEVEIKVISRVQRAIPLEPGKGLENEGMASGQPSIPVKRSSKPLKSESNE